MYPKNPKFNNESEEKVYKYIEENLPKDYVAYYNYDIDINEFDFCLFVPFKGILMIEVKSWTADNIKEIIDNNFILYKTKEGEKVLGSPYNQAKRYSYAMIDELEKKVSGSILVLPVVCYTNITEEEYIDKRLDIISPKKFTIFKEDLESKEKVLDKISEMFKNAVLVYKKKTDYFDFPTMAKAREIFEPREKIKKTSKNKIRPYVSKEFYSILRYLPREEIKNIDSIGEELLSHWIAGTKLIIITNCSEIEKRLYDKIKILLEELNIEDKFPKEIYNFYLYLVDMDLNVGFQIIDGDIMEIFKNRRILLTIDAKCNYNLNQYMIEHYTGEKNIIVKAGAGTGKTFTMISRIMFLIHNEKMRATDLVENIYLMTFTNEAADSMKDKLKTELMNYYIITGDFNYFEMINAVEDMKISTIHSLTIDILRRYSHYLGLGSNFTIASGKYERNTNLMSSLNDYIENIEKEKIMKYDLSMYNMRKIIEILMGKLENKNIDILNTELILDDGKHKELNKLLKTVLIDAEIGTRNDLKRNNSMKLADIIISLREILIQLRENQEVDNIGPKYLFIDEFQDTDNMQIDLIKEFMEVFDFKLFVVGDTKQCIYRFRGAEENAFDRLIEFNNDHRWRNFTLNKNYRTDKNLLGNFEHIFQDWGNKDRLQYSSSKDSLRSNIELNKKDGTYFKKIQVPTDNDIDFENALVEELKYQLKHLPKNKSIAILVRENKEVNRIMQIGRKYEIPIETDKAGDLYKLESTLDLYKLIIALQNNKSPKHLYNLYDTSYVSQKLPLKEIYLRKQNEEELVKYFYSNCPIENWDYYLEGLKKEPALKVLREIVLDIKPWRIYKEKHDLENKDLEDYKRNLDLLFEILTEKSKTDYLTISKIEHSLGIMIKTGQEEKTRTYSENMSDKGKIKCMTVHKAKGLEFYTVILPFTNTELATDKKAGKYDFIIVDGDTKDKVNIGYKLKKDQSYRFIKNKFYEDEETIEKNFLLNEETRILYVAMTRAIKNLSYFEYVPIKDEECWQKFLGAKGE